MKNCKVVANKAFYLGDLKENILFYTAMELIKNNIAVYGIDNCGIIYLNGKDKIDVKEIDIEKEYMKVSAKFSIPEGIDTDFKQITLEQAILMYTQEEEIWIEQEYHLDIFLLPFQVRILNQDILIYPIIKLFEDNIMIISYNIYVDNDMTIKEFKNVFADINRHLFEKISIPINYAPKSLKSKGIIMKMDGEKTKYIEMDTTEEYFDSIINISLYFIDLFNISEQTGIFYGRCSYFIENDKKINKGFIDTLLKGVEGNYKYELQDFSINRDYKKYFNERASIVLGKYSNQLEPEIQVIEERMMIQTIRESKIIDKLQRDCYTYKKLKKIYMDMLYNNIQYRDSNYGEIEDILKVMHSFMKREEKMNYLKIGLEEKIKEKEYYYQEKIALFALLLSAEPISEYILFPITNNFLHLEKVYIIIEKLKQTWMNTFLKVDYLKGICFVVSIILIYYIYKRYLKRK